MSKPEIIENQQILKSFCKHKQAACMVVLDLSLEQNSRLLCPQCLVNFESDKKIIGIDRVNQMIEETQNEKKDKVDSLLKPDIELVKLLQQHLIKLQTLSHQKLQNIIENSEQWIQTLLSLGKKYQTCNFFNELEFIIKNENSVQIVEKYLIQDIGVNNQSYQKKLIQNLQWFQQFDQYQQCKEILQKISFTYTLQKMKQVPYPSQLLEVDEQFENNIIQQQHIPDSKEINKIINELKLKYQLILPQINSLLSQQMKLLFNQQELQRCQQQLLLNQLPILRNKIEIQKNFNKLINPFLELNPSLGRIQQQINDQLQDLMMDYAELRAYEKELKENQIKLINNKMNLHVNQQVLLEDQSNLLLSHLLNSIEVNNELKDVAKNYLEVNYRIRIVYDVWSKLLQNQQDLHLKYDQLHFYSQDILKNQDNLRDNQKELLKNQLELYQMVSENFEDVFKLIKKLVLLILKPDQIKR